MTVPSLSVLGITVLGSGLIAGVFYAFSTFVMRALADRPPGEGIRAMQAINVTVINPWFLVVFVGTAVACLYVGIRAVIGPAGDHVVFLLLGSALYVFGTFGVTIAFNVPLNDKLAGFEEAGPESEAFWKEYVLRWTFWNHVRTGAAVAATAALMTALYLAGTP